MFGLAGSGFNEKAVSLSRRERIRPGIADDRVHAANVLPVGKHFYRHGIGVRFQFPDGQGIFVARQCTDRDDLQRSKSIGLSENEIDAAETLVVRHEQELGLEPIAEMNNIDDAKNDRHRDENPGFFIHKTNERYGCLNRRTNYQTRQREEML
jgi:hypothetical protein